jgi:hypothetical protein
LRGATVALGLLIAAALLRDHGRLIAARLGALFAFGTGPTAITSTPSPKGNFRNSRKFPLPGNGGPR